MKPRISMITLGVRDLDVSIAFYEKGLGLPRLESPPGVAFFSLNGTWLGLYGHDALAEDAEIPAVGSGFRGCALAHNVGSEEEVDAVVQQALDAGATLVKKPRKVFWGGYSGYFADPDGHLWEVAHNPFMSIGPQDPPTPPDIRYVVIHRPGPAWKAGIPFREQPGVEQHVEHFKQLLAEGRLASGGPFVDDSGGMMIPAPGETKESIEEFAASDPTVKSGLLEFEVKPWYVAMSGA